MVHHCRELTADSSSVSLRLRRSDVSEDTRDSCIDMRQLQCQTQGRPRGRANVRKRVHLDPHTGLSSDSTSVWIHARLDLICKQNTEPPAVQRRLAPSGTVVMMFRVVIALIKVQFT